MGATHSVIDIRNANLHNLQTGSFAIPKEKIVVIDGASGSGKTSLLIGILAEISRRRVEQAKIISRNLLLNLILEDKELGKVTGLPPVVECNKILPLSKSDTIASSLNLEVLVNELWSDYGVRICPQCGEELIELPDQDYVDKLIQEHSNSLIAITCQLPAKIIGKDPVASTLLREGFSHLISSSGLIQINDLKPNINLYNLYPDAELVLDRLKPDLEKRLRILQALHLGLGLSSKNIHIYYIKDDRSSVEKISSFYQGSACLKCSYTGLHDIEQYFSFKLAAPHLEISLNNCKGVSELTEVEKTEIGQVMLADISLKFILEENVSAVYEKLCESSLKKSSLSKLLSSICKLNLENLKLLQTTQSLSTGELHRLKIAASTYQTNTRSLYVVDRASESLDQKTLSAVLDYLRKIVDEKNSLLIADQHPNTRLIADNSITLSSVHGSNESCVPKKDNSYTLDEKIVCSIVNKNLTLEFPANKLIALGGRSGIGKSRFLFDQLAPTASEKLKGTTFNEEKSFKLSLPDSIKRVTTLRLPAATSGLTIVASELELLAHFANFFAQTDNAKAFGYTKQSFLLNTRKKDTSLVCPACGGYGINEQSKICSECDGLRYNQESYSILWRDKSIAQLLDLSLGEAKEFIEILKDGKELSRLVDMLFIHYLRMSLPLKTISTGERIKIGLAKSFLTAKPDTLMLLEQPAQGFGEEETTAIVSICRKLNMKGVSIIAEEHNPYFLELCDAVVELNELWNLS